MKNSEELIYAPVLIPTINRYDHFVRCLESLEVCTGAEKTDVYVALDYPPSERYRKGWKRIDAYLHEKEKNNGFNHLIVYRRETNYFFSGKGNITSLINELQDSIDRFIISEDDNEFSPNFLDYMNKCLNKYYYNQDVVCITGYSYPVNWIKDNDATVQIQNFNASAWGRAWWLSKYQKIKEEMDNGILYNNAYNDIKFAKYKRLIDPSLIEYTLCVIGGTSALLKNTSDIGMRLYIAMRDKYVVSPLTSLVRNNGFDGTGQYCDNNNSFIDNRHALSYNYPTQQIDTNRSFEIIENDKRFLEKNRILLNDFDSRPKRRVFFAKLIIYLAKFNLLGLLRLIVCYYRKVKRCFRNIQNAH